MIITPTKIYKIKKTHAFPSRKYEGLAYRFRLQKPGIATVMTAPAPGGCPVATPLVRFNF